jgi:hypothetical protein
VTANPPAAFTLKLVIAQGWVRSFRLCALKPKPLGQARLTPLSLIENAAG